MTTIKEILTENRDSIISSIKYTYKIWKDEDVKSVMINFLSFANKNANIDSLLNSKRVKSDLKSLIIRMKVSEDKERKDAYNMSVYGTTHPKLADMIGMHNEDNE